MGRAAGAALKVAAPEVAAARKLDHRAQSPAEMSEELQRRRRDAAARSAAKRSGASQPAAGEQPTSTEQTSGSSQSESAARSAPTLPTVPAAASTGSGFLLGLIAWAGALAYLQGGMPAVRRLAAAKFLNKTT